MALSETCFYIQLIEPDTMHVESIPTRFIYLFKNNNTGPKASDVLQQKKNKHTNTEQKHKHRI